MSVSGLFLFLIPQRTAEMRLELFSCFDGRKGLNATFIPLNMVGPVPTTSCFSRSTYSIRGVCGNDGGAEGEGAVSCFIPFTVSQTYRVQIFF